jgi:hypothetical protein
LDTRSPNIMSLTIPINQLPRFRATIKVSPTGNLTLQLDALSDGHLGSHPFANIQAGIHFEASKDQKEYIVSVCHTYPHDHGLTDGTYTGKNTLTITLMRHPSHESFFVDPAMSTSYAQTPDHFHGSEFGISYPNATLI